MHHQPRNNHNHLVRRLQKTGHENRSNDEVHAVRADAKRRVKKRAPGGGKTCRIRQNGQGLSSSAVIEATATASATAAASSAQDSAAPAASTEAWTSAVESSSQAAPQETAPASSTWVEAPPAETAPATSSVWVQPSAAPAAPAAGSGGWMNSGSKVGLCWPNGDWVSFRRRQVTFSAWDDG